MDFLQTEHLWINPVSGLVTDPKRRPLGTVKAEGSRLVSDLPEACRAEALAPMADRLFLRGAEEITGDHPLSREKWYPCPVMRPFRDVDTLPGETIELTCTCVNCGDPARGLAPEYHFDITPRGSCRLIGRISLRLGMDERLYYAGHIGYGIIPEARGHRYAAQACRLLVPLMRRHGMEAAVLTCRPDNAASRRTIESLGARLVCCAPLPRNHELYQPNAPVTCIYRWQFF